MAGLIASAMPNMNTLNASDGTKVAATDAMADDNWVGFQRVVADGDMFDTTYKANTVTQVVVKADAITNVADTFVKLGMYFDGTRLYFYKNGLVLPDSKAITTVLGTDFPSDVNLGACVGLFSGDGSDATMTLDWVRAAQAIY